MIQNSHDPYMSIDYPTTTGLPVDRYNFSASVRDTLSEAEYMQVVSGILRDAFGSDPATRALLDRLDEGLEMIYSNMLEILHREVR